MDSDFSDDLRDFLWQNATVTAGQTTLDDLLAAEEILFGAENIPADSGIVIKMETEERC